MMQRIKHSLNRIMQGRYGFDSMSAFLMLCGAMAVVLGWIICLTPLAGYRIGYILNVLFTVLAWFFIIWGYARVFSRNYSRRLEENQRFERTVARIKASYARMNARRRIRRTHHIYTCPGCSQKIKIPKGKGRVLISCPKCRMEFTKKS